MRRWQFPGAGPLALVAALPLLPLAFAAHLGAWRPEAAPMFAQPSEPASIPAGSPEARQGPSDPPVGTSSMTVPAMGKPPPPTAGPAVPPFQPTPQAANPRVYEIELTSSTGLADVIGAPREAELPPGDIRVVVH